MSEGLFWKLFKNVAKSRRREGNGLSQDRRRRSHSTTSLKSYGLQSVSVRTRRAAQAEKITDEEVVGVDGIVVEVEKGCDVAGRSHFDQTSRKSSNMCKETALCLSCRKPVDLFFADGKAIARRVREAFQKSGDALHQYISIKSLRKGCNYRGDESCNLAVIYSRSRGILMNMLGNSICTSLDQGKFDQTTSAGKLVGVLSRAPGLAHKLQ
ncbi:hypothetical protein TNCV_1003651, partial [Trichonephila clavipes]